MTSRQATSQIETGAPVLIMLEEKKIVKSLLKYGIVGIIVSMFFALPIVNPLLAVQLGQAHSVGAWHGSTTPTSDCGGWIVEVDTTWSGYVGSIDSSSNLTGSWTDGQTSVNWSVTVRWATGETWSDSGTISKMGDCTPQVLTREASKCDGTTYVSWKEQSTDGGKTWTKVDGIENREENSTKCGYVPPTKPTGHWCLECQKVTVPPQSTDCVFPLGGTVLSVKDGKSDVAFNQMPWGIQFTDGDRMNAKPVLNYEMSTGEKITMQMTPGVTYDPDRKGCYMATSSFHPEGFKAGSILQITSANGAGDPCVYVLVWVEDKP